MEQIDKSNKKKLTITKKGIIILLCFLFIFGLITRFIFYICSNDSKIKNIIIKGNYFVSDEYIKELIDIDYNDSYIFLFSSFKEMDARQNDLIKDISIKRDAYNTVIVTVEENNILGYCFDDKNQIGNYQDDYMQLILADKTKIDFNSDYIKGFGILTKFTNIENDKLDLIIDKLKNVNIDILKRISEIKLEKFTFEENMVKLITNDGYIVYCSISNLNNIEYYLDIITNTQSPYYCIYIYQVDDKYNANVIDCKDFENGRIETN